MNERWFVHTIVFDLDDTLYPEREFVLGGFAAAGAWLKTLRGIDGFAEEAQQLFAAGHRGLIFDQALERLGVPKHAGLVSELVEVYRTHRPVMRLFPDAEEILVWASGNGLRLALVTDGYAAVQRNKIGALGLDDRIPCRVISDELGGKGHWKPSPRPFIRVMEQLPGTPEGFVYVADNPRKDFIAPRHLGWKTIRVRRAGGEHAAYECSESEMAEKEIPDLTGLHALLAPSRKSA